jgi:amino acid permease
MIGIGFLTLPSIGKEIGYWPMIYMVTQSTLISLTANLQLGRGFFITKEKTFDAIVAKICGRVYGTISRIFLLFYVFASTAAYYMIGNTFIQTLLFQIKVIKTTSNETVRVLFIICVFVVSQLLSAPKKISFLSYFTFITAILVLGVAVVSLLIISF